MNARDIKQTLTVAPSLIGNKLVSRGGLITLDFAGADLHFGYRLPSLHVAHLTVLWLRCIDECLPHHGMSHNTVCQGSEGKGSVPILPVWSLLFSSYVPSIRSTGLGKTMESTSKCSVPVTGGLYESLAWGSQPLQWSICLKSATHIWSSIPTARNRDPQTNS